MIHIVIQSLESLFHIHCITCVTVFDFKGFIDKSNGVLVDFKIAANFFCVKIVKRLLFVRFFFLDEWPDYL